MQRRQASILSTSTTAVA